jgi:non-ribosomal peptide synthetase component F
LTKELKALSYREGTTLFMTMLAAFQAMLFCCTGQVDVCVGTPSANRNKIELEGLIGYFNNMLVLRTNLSGNPTFRNLLARVREVVLDAYAHQDLPLAKQLEILQPNHDLSQWRLPVKFTLQEPPTAAMQNLLPLDLELSTIQVPSEITKGDLILTMEHKEDKLIGLLCYNTLLFETSTITRMVSQFQDLLEGFVVNIEQEIEHFNFD